MVSRHADRSPIWPEGYIGSISHSQDIACAVVASSNDYQSIGIDIEYRMSEQQADKLTDTII